MQNASNLMNPSDPNGIHWAIQDDAEQRPTACENVISNDETEKERQRAAISSCTTLTQNHPFDA